MIKAVVFDLDGTLTRPLLDFKRIRAEIGVPFGKQSLLDQIEPMTEAEQARAHAILEKHERRAAQNAQVNEGVNELLAYLKSHGVPCAIVTRNSAQSTEFVVATLGIEVERIITRDSDLPIKPDPAALLSLMRSWSVAPEEVLMVGDFRYDVECGKAAGAITCFIDNGLEASDDGGPTYRVGYPGEVILLLKQLGHYSRGSG